MALNPVQRVTETIHGNVVHDDFRWLEEDNATVLEWIEKQNEHTQQSLAPKTVELLRKELAPYLKAGRVLAPVKIGEFYFWKEVKAEKNQPEIYMKKGLNGKAILLIDPNTINEEGTVAMDYWNPSPKGKYIAYGLSEGGSEDSTMHILDTEKKKDVNEMIAHARYSSIAWLPDETGFYYTKQPAPESVPKGDEFYYRRVYFHTLHTDPQSDPLIFGEGRDKEDMPQITISTDGKYLGIMMQQGWTRNECYLYDTKTKRVTIIQEKIDAISNIALANGSIFLTTNHNAERRKVICAPLDNIPTSIAEWKTFLPEKEEKLESVFFTKEKIIAEYNTNACSRLEMYHYNGKKDRDIPTPPFSVLFNLTGRRFEKEFFVDITSFLMADKITRYNPETEEFEEYHTGKLSLPEDEYEVRQEWYSSKDGTKVPMFIFGKKSALKKGQSPAVLTAYGGFGSSQTPAFQGGWIPFIRRGGVFASANIRGGGEFGRKWHESAIRGQKQKSYDDFIAAAEYLVEKKYTTPGKLTISGGSNGGLMVAACMLQRPALFSAVICRVPLTDMVRFPLFYIGKRWTSEYGDPALAHELTSMLKWSPYHNVKKDVKYPPILITTAVKDMRVHPLHSRKFVALLQNSHAENVALLRTETDAGHGPGASREKGLNLQADVLAFMDKHIHFVK